LIALAAIEAGSSISEAARKTIEDFDFSFQRSLQRDTLLHLGTLDWMSPSKKLAEASQ
jgi:DNA replication protein DnaC